MPQAAKAAAPPRNARRVVNSLVMIFVLTAELLMTAGE
jgi:hypothetical protein